MKLKQQIIKISMMGWMLLALAACAPTTGNLSQPLDNGAVEDSNEEDLAETAVPPTVQPSASTGSLQGISWVLQSYAGQPALADKVVTVEFRADGQLAGTAGCNSYSGSYQLDGGAISIAGVGSTEMWCEGAMDQESAFLSMLLQAESWTLTDGTLIVSTTQGDLVFSEAVDAVLETTDWQLNGIAAEDAVVSDAVDADIRITFVDGTVSGSAGCNTFSGSYTVAEDGVLTFGPLMTTLMTCDDDRNERETQFLDALSRAAGYRIEMEQLVMMDADGNDLVFMNVPAPKGVLSDQYIVTLKIDLETLGSDSENAATALTAMAEEVMATTNGEMVRTLGIINGFVARGLTDADVAALQKNPMVRSVEPDRIITIDPIENTETFAEKTVFVAAEKVDCVGVGPQECYLVKENVDDEWTYYYDEIIGFTWESGYEYELKIRETRLLNPPADGSSIIWSLISVVSKTAVNE